MTDAPRTLVEWIRHWAETRGDDEAIFDRVGSGSWRAKTWRQYFTHVRSIAKGLIALGLEPGEPVAILGENRTEWVCCQFGVAAAAGVSAPIYVTNTVEQVAYIVRHSGARFAICDGPHLLGKYLSAVDQGLMDVDHIITMDRVESDSEKVMSLEALVALGDRQTDEVLDARLAAAQPDDLTMLIFTSGTTGLPKGAMYTHRSIETTGEGTAALYPWFREHPPRAISYLPLCHAAEQGITNFVGLRLGGQTYFCRDIGLIKDCLPEVRPTIFLGVPRVWEKFEAALRGRLAEASGLKARLAAWALRKELEGFRKDAAGENGRSFGRQWGNKLVISKIKGKLGLDALELAATGAAPISLSTLEFFASIGIPLHEGYGMTETTSFATLQLHRQPRFGTIGKAFPGVTVRIADDGEILLRGDNMVKGYYKLPDRSAELWTEDGWMQTGDLGALDDAGYLRITGRKKDLIITAGGKNVAPSEIEGLLQAIPGVGQAVVIGDAKPYLSALLVLDPEAIPELCKAAGVEVAPAATLAADERVQAFFTKAVEEGCNARLARYQTIKKFEVIAAPFTVDGGELTPTMKVKRDVVNAKYAAVIAGMYA